MFSCQVSEGLAPMIRPLMAAYSRERFNTSPNPESAHGRSSGSTEATEPAAVLLLNGASYEQGFQPIHSCLTYRKFGMTPYTTAAEDEPHNNALRAPFANTNRHC